MSVKRVNLQRFSVFEEADFEFSPGINVFIGANSTGKTHIMKLLYSLLKVCEVAQKDHLSSREKIEEMMAQKLLGVFKPERVGRLVQRGRGRNSSSVKLAYNDEELQLVISSLNKITLEYDRLPDPVSALYLPAHEFLSIYEGFISAYTQRETSFDETFYDLSLALNALPLRGPRLSELGDLIMPLEKAIVGKVVQENGRFYVRLPEGKFEAHLVSEGFRKIAGLIYLISNGSLTQNGILFWDEPEANLNPRLVVLLVQTLRVLAQHGVQIFLATHDYLLSQELSLLAEYPSETPLRFFALHRPKRGAGVVVEAGNSLVDIENNPILDEFAAHYERERDLFHAGV